MIIMTITTIQLTLFNIALRKNNFIYNLHWWNNTDEYGSKAMWMAEYTEYTE